MSTVLGQPIPLGGEGAVKYNTAQTLTTEQKEQVCENIGVSDAVKYNTDQTLTTEQQEQAQKNIGVTKPIRTVVSLPTASWTGDDPYSQTVTISGGTANHAADLLPSAEVAAQMVEDGVQYMCIENNDGTFTAKAVGAAPTVDLSVQVLLTEVAT